MDDLDDIDEDTYDDYNYTSYSEGEGDEEEEKICGGSNPTGPMAFPDATGAFGYIHGEVCAAMELCGLQYSATLCALRKCTIY